MSNDFTINRRQMLAGAGAALASTAFPQLSLAKTSDGVFDLRAVEASKKLAGDDYSASRLWLYNGTTPGPEIRVKQGETISVRFTNELDEPTSVHWHGIRIDNAMDGVAGLTQEPVMPGKSFDYEFTVPDAGTFWYHAHNKSWEQVARGLYGPLIVDEAEPPFPRDRDFTLVIDDWRLANDGRLDLASLGSLRDWSHAGRLGNWLTINGTSQPRFNLTEGQNHRLRLINVCNARAVSFNPNSIGAQILGYDGFVFDEPRAFSGDQLTLTPAQRVDLLLRPDDGETLKLTETGGFALEEISGREAVRVATFEIKPSDGSTEPENIKLEPNNLPEPDIANAQIVDLFMSGGAMGGMGHMMGGMGGMMRMGRRMMREQLIEAKQVWAFNGVANLTKLPLFSARRGETVVIRTVNDTGWLHGMHVHGHHFQIIHRNGSDPVEKIWRDTFTIDRDETVDMAFVADNPGKWLLHCHMLEHAAAGMQTWFEVT